MPRTRPNRLWVYSVFTSISGEVGLFSQGSITTFVRLAGCNLNCHWCDTYYAQEKKSGKPGQPINVVLEMILNRKCKQVILTGGEPLVQGRALSELIPRLKKYGIRVTIESNGSINPHKALSEEALKEVDCWVMDYKLHGSGMTETMINYDTFVSLPETTYVKFVCADWPDCSQAFTAIERMREANKKRNSQDRFIRPLHFALSCAYPLQPARLVEWMLKRPAMRDVLLNVQIHKIIWPRGEEGDREPLSQGTI